MVVDLSSVWHKLQLYTDVYIQAQINVPIINGNLQQEVGESFKISEIQNQEVMLKASFSESIAISQETQISAKVGIIYYLIL